MNHTEEWKENLSIMLYNFGRMTDREELSNAQEKIEEFVESLLQKKDEEILAKVEGKYNKKK